MQIIKVIQRKEENGITLIALVITIIVLLILAGITIDLAIGNEGIIEKARSAANKTNDAVKEEQKLIEDLEDEVDSYQNGTAPKLNKYIGQKITSTTTMQDSEGNKLTVPKGFKLVDPEKDGTVKYTDKSNPKVDEGIVIEDDDGNQFVWVPVEDISEFKLRSWNGEKISEEPAENAYWSMNLTAVPQLGKANVNQPIKNESNVNFNNISSLVQKVMTVQHNNILNGYIEKYKGFYVGRYELSYNETEEKLETQKNKTPYYKSGAELSGMIEAMNRKLIDTKSIENDDGSTRTESTYLVNVSDISRQLVYGEQWDTLINWINKTNPDYNNKGNYTENIANTGSNDAYRVNNIYDLSGNVGEWSYEGYGKIAENTTGSGNGLGDIDITSKDNQSKISQSNLIEKVSVGFQLHRAPTIQVYRGKDLELQKANTRNTVNSEEMSKNIGGRMAFLIAPEITQTTEQGVFGVLQ